MYNTVISTQMSCSHLFCIFDFSIFETIIIVASHQPLKHTEELAVFKSLNRTSSLGSMNLHSHYI